MRHHTQSTTYARPTTAPRRGGLLSRLRPRPRATPRATRHSTRGATKAPLIKNRRGHPTSSTYATANTYDTHSRHEPVPARHAGVAARRTGFFKRRQVVQQRKPTIGDKISGAMLKLKGSLTRRPGKKAAGTRRMHGTDGRGQRRVY